MRTRDLERYKKSLLEMRELLQKGWDSFEKENLAQNLRDQLGQVSSFSTHPADMGSVIDEQERAFLLAGLEKTTLDLIDRALVKIENGGFGTCQSCKNHIEKDRLNLVPYAEYCLKCQETVESEDIDEEEFRPVTV
jgi:RNA polymerase-binding transcription factor DksA